MFWGIEVLFLIFMFFAYVQPMSVDLKVDEGKNIQHQINGGADNGGKEKKEYSMDDLVKMSDVVKDCAEAMKDLAKAHYYMAEHCE